MDRMPNDITIREATVSESAIILHHRRSMGRDMGEGTAEELDRMVEVAGPWLTRGLADGSYHHWMAWAAWLREVACCSVRGRRILKTLARRER